MQFLGRSLKFSVLVEAYESITAISKLINLKVLNKTDDHSIDKESTEEVQNIY